MAADYDVQIVAVDSAMDCYEHVVEAAYNLRAAASFDISTMGDAIGHRICDKESDLADTLSEIEELRIADAEARAQWDAEHEDEDYPQPYFSEYSEQIAEAECRAARLEMQIARLRELGAEQSMIQDEWETRSSAIMGCITECEATGKRMMAAYIRKIQGVDGLDVADGMATNPYTGQGGYVVVTIDSKKYPETAEHVRVATREGHPSYLTLSRSRSAERRQQSLAGIRSRGTDGFDRDEYPPAAFVEGGAGSHVVYMSFADNRGSGSSFARQLQNFPDGTRVRFRVV